MPLEIAELALYQERNARPGVQPQAFRGGGYGNLAEHEGKGYADLFVPHGHTGSRNNLIGASASDELSLSVSCERLVSPQTGRYRSCRSPSGSLLMWPVL